MTVIQMFLFAMISHTQALEEELSVFEADWTSLQGKVDELKNLVGDQSFERGNMICLHTESGKVREWSRANTQHKSQMHEHISIWNRGKSSE